MIWKGLVHPLTLNCCAPDRVEAMTLSDCQQELSLVQAVTQGPHAFLNQEEAQHFIKA